MTPVDVLLERPINSTSDLSTPPLGPKILPPPACSLPTCAAPLHRQHSAQRTQRIKLLAVAFNACRNPSTLQVHKLSRRTNMPPEEIEEWFQRRRVLDEWVSENGITTTKEVTVALTHYGMMIDMARGSGIAHEEESSDDMLLPIAMTTVQSLSPQP